MISFFLVLFIFCGGLLWRQNLLTQVVQNREKYRAKLKDELNISPFILGFLHPYADAGGGGERVLWAAVDHVMRTRPDVFVVIYGGPCEPEKVLLKVKERFGIDIDFKRIDFVALKRIHLLEAQTWPYMTMAGQSLSSLICATSIEEWPDVMLDSMGYAFTTWWWRFIQPRMPLGAYVHYPIISEQMDQRVKARIRDQTNGIDIARSLLKTKVKVAYYALIRWLYVASLRNLDLIMANGSWTQNHLKTLTKRDIVRVYPPCDTMSMQKFDIRQPRSGILSLSQFRAEKRQNVQIQAYAEFRRQNPHSTHHLTLLGSVRPGDPRDTALVEELKRLVQELGLSEYVHFIVNATYSELLEELSHASIGLSTMIDEHFGINVVEFMASGLIPLVHASAGPYLDIVVPLEGQATGIHAESVADFAKGMETILEMGTEDTVAMRQRARQVAQEKFNTAVFERDFQMQVDKLIAMVQR